MCDKMKFGTHLSELRHPGDRARNIYTILFTLLPLLLLSCSNLDRENPAAAIALQTTANQSSITPLSSKTNVSSSSIVVPSSIATQSSATTISSSSIAALSSTTTINSSSIAASSSAATIVWKYTNGSGFVATGGYWFSFNDNSETVDLGPGASTSDVPTSNLSDVIGPWAATNGMNVNFSIGGSTYKYPYAGIGFNWKDPQDLSPQTWTNICVEYSLTGVVPMQIELLNDPTLDGYNWLKQVLPVQQTMGFKCFAASEFAQESGWGKTLTVADGMAQSLGMRIRARRTVATNPAETCHLIIHSIITN